MALTSGSVQAHDSIILPIAGWERKQVTATDFQGKSGLTVVLAVLVGVWWGRGEC